MEGFTSKCTILLYTSWFMFVKPKLKSFSTKKCTPNYMLLKISWKTKQKNLDKKNVMLCPLMDKPRTVSTVTAEHVIIFIIIINITILIIILWQVTSGVWGFYLRLCLSSSKVLYSVWVCMCVCVNREQFCLLSKTKWNTQLSLHTFCMFYSQNLQICLYIHICLHKTDSDSYCN